MQTFIYLIWLKIANWENELAIIVSFFVMMYFIETKISIGPVSQNEIIYTRKSYYRSQKAINGNIHTISKQSYSFTASIRNPPDQLMVAILALIIFLLVVAMMSPLSAIPMI